MSRRKQRTQVNELSAVSDRVSAALSNSLHGDGTAKNVAGKQGTQVKEMSAVSDQVSAALGNSLRGDRTSKNAAADTGHTSEGDVSRQRFRYQQRSATAFMVMGQPRMSRGNRAHK
jgi:hypothetical protein